MEFPSYLTYITMWHIVTFFFFINVVSLSVLLGGHKIEGATAASPLAAFAWSNTCRAAQTMFVISLSHALVVVVLYWGLIFTSGESRESCAMKKVVRLTNIFLVFRVESLGALSRH
jgi:hypothetical protein